MKCVPRKSGFISSFLSEGLACLISTILCHRCNFLSCNDLVGTFPTTNIFDWVCTRNYNVDGGREKDRSESDAES